jgi:tetratricopeptide (TPR) repeat protein
VEYTLYHLGILYNTLGRYAEAETLLRRSLAIRLKLGDSGSRDIARISNELGNLYAALGRDAEAERCYKRAIEINEAGGPSEESNLGISLYNLANIYRDQGRCAEAEALFRRAIGIWEKIFGPDHYDVGGGCIELGLLCSKVGRYAEAESLLHRAVVIADNTFGPDNGDAARAYRGLGEVCLARGQYAEAETYLQQALAVFEPDPAALEENLPNTLESLVRLHRSRGEADEALQVADRAMNLRRRALVDNVYALSEKDALAYSTFLRNSIDTYLTCQWDLGPPDSRQTGQLADVLFSGKGQVSDGIFERRRGLADESDPAVLELAEQLRRTKFLLSQLFVEGPGEDEEAYRRPTSPVGAPVIGSTWRGMRSPPPGSPPSCPRMAFWLSMSGTTTNRWTPSGRCLAMWRWFWNLGKPL